MIGGQTAGKARTLMMLGKTPRPAIAARLATVTTIIFPLGNALLAASPGTLHPIALHGSSGFAGAGGHVVSPVMRTKPWAAVDGGTSQKRKPSGSKLSRRFWARGVLERRSRVSGHAEEVPLDAIATGAATASPSELRLVERFGKGVLSDVKGKTKLFLSDFKDGVSIKVLSSTFFLFFACLAPAVAFGGLLGVVTGGAMGTIEMIAATAICGITYAAFAGQPLTIIGSTGPVLAFTAVLYKTAAKLQLPFLPLYSWVGLWTALLLGISSVFSLSNMVLFFTRFTDEIFSLLISVIFIVEATKDITGVFSTAGVPLAVATSTLVVALTTYSVATTLKAFRRSPFFKKPVREIVADFAPTLGVAAGTLAAIWAKGRYGLMLPTLNVPMALTTTVGRPWRVPILDLPVWARWAAFFPALMSTVLLFMDQNITVRLVNSKQHNLKKGFGMHLDMAIISLLTAACSLFGLPWLVAATVRSLAHVKSLTNYEQLGGGEERIVGVQEQRVSGIAIHGLIGLAVLRLRPLLSQVPLPVTTGLFLYLGVGGLKGNEMWDRTKLLFTDGALRPKAPWTGRVSITKTNVYTLIQLACLGSMMVMKSSPIGVLFPVLIALLAPLRVLLEKTRLFSKEEMAVLDSEG